MNKISEIHHVVDITVLCVSSVDHGTHLMTKSFKGEGHASPLLPYRLVRQLGTEESLYIPLSWNSSSAFVWLTDAVDIAVACS